MLTEVYSTRRGTRRDALIKLAELTAQTTTSQDGGDDMSRLCGLGKSQVKTAPNGPADLSLRDTRVSSVPMSVRELEFLVALCKAAPFVQGTADAQNLLRQLSPYLPEAHQQCFSQSSLHQKLPPWETLSFDLASAVLVLALNFPSLREGALQTINTTIEELTQSAETIVWTAPEGSDSSQRLVAEQSLPAIQLTVSLLGFLNAVSHYVRVWRSEETMAMIQKCRYLLSEKFMVPIEGALSAVRNARSNSIPVKEWKHWVRGYASRGSPLGAMVLQRAFMNVVEEVITLILSYWEPRRDPRFLNTLLHRKPLVDQSSLHVTNDMIEHLTDVVVDEISFLEADADYLRVSSAWQQRLAHEVKSSSLRSYLGCSLMNESIADDEILLSWFDAITSDPIQMADEHLAHTVLKSMAILSRTSAATASNLSRSMPRLLVQGKLPPATARLAGKCLAQVLNQLSQDMVISTLYSLGNVLSSSGGNENPAGIAPLFDGNGSVHGSAHPYTSQQGLGSSLSLVTSDEEETMAVHVSIIQAIVAIAVECNDEKMTALVDSMLVQKIGRISPAVDARIITETATLGLYGGPDQLKNLVRLYTRVASEATAKHDSLLIVAVTDARVRLANCIKRDSPLFAVYLIHLLALCVSCGDTAGERTVDTALATKSIAQLFRPTAILLSTDTERPLRPDFQNESEILELGRDAWFNIVVHGFTLTSNAGREHTRELQVLAQYSLPLVNEDRVDMPESGIDLNTVLRRGAGGQQAVEQKSTLIDALPQCESEIKGLSYPDCVFLNAALLVTTLRARTGDCTGVLSYFLENKVKKTPMGNVMLAVANKSVETYLECALSGQEQRFAAPQVAIQLASFFAGACHRIAKVQLAAVSAADRIINQIPSALCHQASLFALLDLLSLMWKSCLDAETDEYEWKATYTSEKSGASIQVSDDVNYRQTTLTNFHKRCRLWVSKAVDVAPLDVKGLLQAYLEDYEDDGSYGHIALGRSFAVEMGSMIPHTDQKLTSLERQRDVGVNTASDFVAQYTTRQEYRHSDHHIPPSEDWTFVDHKGVSRSAELEPPGLDEANKLRVLSQRLRNHEILPFSHVRELLHDAAAVLSKGTCDRTTLISDLVGIPFQIFTKQSINLGVSLWLGVGKENPSMETRILVEVAAGWETSVRLKKGFFNPSFHHPDPFYVKEEFAPSKWEVISRRQQLTHNLLAPHLRLAYYLASHFSASRLTAPSVERVYSRIMRITMLSMKQTTTQPLAREVHFQIVLLALKVLRYSIHTTSASQWRLKDAILSAGLVWFSVAPRWSFGSNRLQVKAEVKLLNDVSYLLKDLSAIGFRATNSLSSLEQKQELLLLLLSNEIGRLGVWISPLANDTKGLVSSGSHGTQINDTAFVPLVRTAWTEDPRIAVQLVSRYPCSQRLVSEVRWQLLNGAEKAVGDPDALNILLGSSLPADVKVQLKYLLYWAPINPMAAVTYFLPAYGNHPFIIQYAVRTLESHSVDVTFFYVPQIVQTLRYDGLGYVERYIVETAKFSQLFAHQIIWNMKANAFKDEESQEPDPVKPVLDRVMDSLISSFSKEDKVFYEREFDFFGKVTGISGILKPLIKRPKPEKKQKIEEELRKIQVEVGVYLPSNPDGIVIGIDRKSGKPLQSHAKAPFMATFRIRKDEGEIEAAEEKVVSGGEMTKRKTFEVWQSAIFKVGDDCRQDVLALQMIAAFRGIFNNIGLDVYVFPYRVTATAPGCGVIDVLPNSISRDMLGREAVNGLYEYFVSKYGHEDSIRFQEARSNFVKSMAAYSIISFLLQFKDRHNGNIMVDDAGHILHIDFGFCFDVVPGGVKFERAPFKLSPEMVAVMGGSIQSQSFKAFEELCVKAFLASRQYVEQLSHIVMTMLDSGLPCFKPQTMKHFRERFVLEKTDREAAEFVRHLIHVSERSYSTGVYDYYQLLTNGIPY